MMFPFLRSQRRVIVKALCLSCLHVILVAFGLHGTGLAADFPDVDLSDKAFQPFERLLKGVTRITLSNGLKVMFYKRDTAPVFTGELWVRVGGVDEVPGVTGVAHLLEHMAFKGTDKIGTKDFAREKVLLGELDRLMERKDRGEEVDSQKLKELYKKLEDIWIDNGFSRLYDRRGAVGLNAATGKDYTVYMVSLPKTAFELWCWVESERILNPVFRQFYKEREVVQEERRMRTDDSPGGRVYEAMLASAFWMHPNRLPIIGWPTDITNLKKSDLERFHKTYYRPDNMVIGLVGDLEVEEVRPLLERYFGRIPKSETPLPQIDLVEEQQRGERDITVEFDAEPSLALAFHKPTFPNPDDGRFAILHSILSEGRSSILYRELVQEKRLASSVGTSEAPGEMFPSIFYVRAKPQKGVSNDKLKNEIQAILDRLKKKQVSRESIEAAKRRVRVSILHGLSSYRGLTRFIAKSELLWGDWKRALLMYKHISETTPADLQRMAQTYFKRSNRTYVHLEKVSDSGEGK